MVLTHTSGSKGRLSYEYECYDDEIARLTRYFRDIDYGVEVEEEEVRPPVLGMEDDPPELTCPLLPHQKQWLWWSLRREASSTRGGILADEMGMGKTIQAISLILASRALDKQSSTPQPPPSPSPQSLQLVQPMQPGFVSMPHHTPSMVSIPNIMQLQVMQPRLLSMPLHTHSMVPSPNIPRVQPALRVQPRLQPMTPHTPSMLPSPNIPRVQPVLSALPRLSSMPLHTPSCLPRLSSMPLHTPSCLPNHVVPSMVPSSNVPGGEKLPSTSYLNMPSLDFPNPYPEPSYALAHDGGRLMMRPCDRPSPLTRTRDIHPSNHNQSLPRTLSCQPHHDPTLHASEPLFEAMKTTLVICPQTAMNQWAQEIKKSTKEGSLNVLVYHGSNRTQDISQLAQYDVVVTTHPIVEVEYRNSSIRYCTWCKDKLSLTKLETHARRCLKRPTRYSGGRTYYSISTQRDVKKSSNAQGDHVQSNVVDAVEGKLETSRKSNQRSKKRSILHLVRWNRIILDEAHVIKDRNTNTAKAMYALQAKYRWCLTGTPIQNHAKELYSLVRFLEVKPFAYRYCEDCTCESLEPRLHGDTFANKCNECGHSLYLHFSWWRRRIEGPLYSSRRYTVEKAVANRLLKTKLVDEIILRRTKLEHTNELNIPPTTNIVRFLTFDKDEEGYYQALYSESQSVINAYAASGTVANNFGHVFEVILRLRQAVDHPYLVEYSKSQRSKRIATATEHAPCRLCTDPPEEPVMSACCQHTFCKGCLLSYKSSVGSEPACPGCKAPLKVARAPSKSSCSKRDWTSQLEGVSASSFLNDIDLEELKSSTKVDALKEELQNMLERDPAAKAVVFSQFTDFLDLIWIQLKKSGHKCLKLDGGMTLSSKNEVIGRFNSDPSCKVLLISLKTGATAINLTAASHAFIMEPWWNPTIEEQAQDRIHRIGQRKPTRVVRFIIENTIEERILKLQNSKKRISEGALKGSLDAFALRDLDYLFE